MAVVDKVAVLRGCMIFGGAADAQLAELAQVTEELTFGPSDVLAVAGERCDAMYVVVDGVLEVLEDGNVVTTLSAGGCVDELAVFDGVASSTDVRAKTAVELLRIQRSDLLEILDQQPALTRAVLAALAGRSGPTGHKAEDHDDRSDGAAENPQLSVVADDL